MSRFIRILILTLLLAAVVFFGFRTSVQMDMAHEQSETVEAAPEAKIVAEQPLEEVPATDTVTDEQQNKTDTIENTRSEPDATEPKAEEAPAEKDQDTKPEGTATEEPKAESTTAETEEEKPDASSAEKDEKQ